MSDDGSWTWFFANNPPPKTDHFRSDDNGVLYAVAPDWDSVSAGVVVDDSPPGSDTVNVRMPADMLHYLLEKDSA